MARSLSLPIPLTMAATRIGAGVLTYAQPQLAAKLFGIKSGEKSSAYTARLFGSRDVALGLAVLSRNPAIRRSTLRLGVLVDTCDAVAAVLETRKRGLTPAGSALLIGGAATFAALGVLALREGD